MTSPHATSLSAFSVFLRRLPDVSQRQGKRGSGNDSTNLIRQQADRWFRYGSDMLTVAALAGLDGPAIRQRYVAGQISPMAVQHRASANHSAA